VTTASETVPYQKSFPPSPACIASCSLELIGTDKCSHPPLGGKLSCSPGETQSLFG